MENMAVILNAWAAVCSFAWMLEANRNARKGKRTRPEVMAFAEKLETNLFLIQAGMMNGTLTLGPYRKKWVYVPKKRLVMALPYADRIAQWCIYLYLNPIYDKLFIEDSYACRKNKGSLAAVNSLQYWMCQLDRKEVGGWYILKLDISKYFYRVNHGKLIEILSRRIRDPCMMAFLRRIVNNTEEPFGLPRWAKPDETPPEQWRYDVGMPIGNLTSQLFANIYLNELDQFCKHKLKIHYYLRYMDDVIILGQKEDLLRWKREIETFLRDELYLDLNSKTTIRPLHAGVEFAGIRVWATHRELRKSTRNHMKRETREMSRKYAAGAVTKEQLARFADSMNGLLENADSGALRQRLNEIYREEMDKADERNGTTHEPFGNHRRAGKHRRNAGKDYHRPRRETFRAGRRRNGERRDCRSGQSLSGNAWQ